MAYDKVIDSSALNANLTSVANAIRSKGGTSASLAFPSGFVDAISKIETGKVTMEEHTVTFASDLGNGTEYNKAVLTGNAFVKENYAKNGFAAILMPVTPAPMTAQYVTHGMYHGNANIGASDAVRYGFAYQSNSASSMGFSGLTDKISGTNYNACFRARNTGNLQIYVSSIRRILAGTYKIIVLCWED